MIEFRSGVLTPNINRVKNVPQIKTVNKYLGELVTVSERNKDKYYEVTTELRNRLGKVLGREVFSLEENCPNSIGFSISVEPEYRKKSFHFGEILRLSSIIMILENKIKEFEIYSKNTAIFFHSKYKFEPAIKQFSERDLALESMISNCQNNGAEYSEMQREAEELLNAAKVDDNAEKQRELCVKANQLLKRYFAKVEETKGGYKSHPFNTGISMRLTDDAIIKSKNFFNELFKKHNIDYKI